MTKSELEYIQLGEALDVTGLAEKTLRAKLRGRVTMFGHASWDRREFFEFFRAEYLRKRSSQAAATTRKANNLINQLARSVSNRTIHTKARCKT